MRRGVGPARRALRVQQNLEVVQAERILPVAEERTMPEFKVFGKIEPPWFEITFDIESQVAYRIEESDIDLKCTIAIKKSNVVATCEANRWDETTLGSVVGYLFDWVGAEIDLFTFVTGMVFTVHLDRAEYPDGSNRELIGTAPELAALATACKSTDAGGTVHVDMHKVLPLIMQNPTLMIAFRDLVAALRFGNNSLTNCGRAMEGLRKSLWGKDEANKAEEKRAWDRLRDTLQVSRPYLQAITDASCGPRHGSTAYIPVSTRKEILNRSWAVMNRFLLYRLGGDQPLSAEEYPML
jgi:hypothetical protein